MSPEITLKSVVLPAPLGPRIARRSPYPMSRSTSDTALRPPKRRPTPRKRRIGSAPDVTAFCVKPSYPTTLTGCALPSQGRLRFSHFGKFRPGAGVEALNVPPKVWSTFGMLAIVLTASLPSFMYSCW